MQGLIAIEDAKLHVARREHVTCYTLNRDGFSLQNLSCSGFSEKS